MQLAFQLALYYMNGCVVPTYESCSTAAFKHGRTETIRSCTKETKATCEIMALKNNNLSTAELKQLIINCSNVHNALTKNAAMGNYTALSNGLLLVALKSTMRNLFTHIYRTRIR